MGVYIKDIKKPKKCEECELFFVSFYIGEGKVGSACILNDDDGSAIEANYNDCQLIEIVTCGECEYADEYNHCKYSAWWNGNADFCSHGIRRKESR